MTEQKFKQLVRIANTDIYGNKNILYGLRKIKGVGFMFANAMCNLADVDKNKKAGELTDEEIERLDKLTKDYSKIPIWMLNRKHDPEFGENLHLFTSNLKLRKEFDIKKMQKIKSYKGLRHSVGLPVRGQRTRSHFRKGSSVGVQRKAVKAIAAAKAKEEKGKK